ncbi:MAG TPA: hypothetical protein DDZ37_07095 [Spirochaetaceae bacterium]|nr:hypothetical protein [Spirochaetaceae bacterium]
MKHTWWIACLVLSLLSAFSAPAMALDLSAMLNFIDEPGLVLHEAFTLRLKFYTEGPEGKPIAEEYYVGYIDDTGLVRKLLQKETYWKPSTSFEEEVIIRKTSDGYYYEKFEIFMGEQDSIGKYFYQLGPEGFTITMYTKFLTPEAIELNGEEMTTTKTITYMQGNGYLWQSDHKRAKIIKNKYIEEEYKLKEFRDDNLLFRDNMLGTYNDLEEDGSPLLKYKYVFSYTKDPTTGEIHGTLDDWLWNIQALFGGPEKWKRNPMEIEVHVKSNLHAQDMHINILNQQIIPRSEYLIPFIYGLRVDYQ